MGRDEVIQGEGSSQMEEGPGHNLDKHQLTLKRRAEEDRPTKETERGVGEREEKTDKNTVP